jgi:hypothetical protein
LEPAASLGWYGYEGQGFAAERNRTGQDIFIRTGSFEMDLKGSDDPCEECIGYIDASKLYKSRNSWSESCSARVVPETPIWASACSMLSRE